MSWLVTLPGLLLTQGEELKYPLLEQEGVRGR